MILVATPILEESVTIPSLRYIVDIGYNVNVYNKYQIKIIEKKIINLSSLT